MNDNTPQSDLELKFDDRFPDAPGPFFLPNELDEDGSYTKAEEKLHAVLDKAHAKLLKLGLDAEELEAVFGLATPAARKTGREAMAEYRAGNREKKAKHDKGSNGNGKNDDKSNNGRPGKA